MSATGLVSVAASTILHATALALITWLLCATVLRRTRPAVHAALWTIVLVKFLLPPVLPGEVTLSSWLRFRMSPAGAISAPPPAPGPDGLFVPHPPLDSPVVPADVPTQGRSEPPLSAVLLAIYALGFLWVVPRSLVDSYRTWRRVRALPAVSGDLLREVRSLARRIGLRRALRVSWSSEETTPFVAGVWRPVLVLPASLVERTPPRTREPLILHELAHLRRGDLAIRWLQNLARRVFYFWPPVWWVCRRIERAAEMACDEWALSASSVEPRTYAAALLDVVRRPERTVIGSQALALARNGRFLQERFEMILNHSPKRSPRLSALALASVLAWSAFSLAGGGAAAEEKKEAMKKRTDALFVKRGSGHGGLFAERWSTLLLVAPSADRDDDGKVTDEEAMAFAESRSSGEKARLLRVAPDADRDGDRQLDARELYALLDARLNHAPMAFARHSTRVHPGEADADGLNHHAMAFADGAARVNPKEADANGDGKISEQEAHEYVKAHPDETVQFEWVDEDTSEPGRKNVEKRIMRFVPEPGRTAPDSD